MNAEYTNEETRWADGPWSNGFDLERHSWGMQCGEAMTPATYPEMDDSDLVDLDPEMEETL